MVRFLLSLAWLVASAGARSSCPGQTDEVRHSHTCPSADAPRGERSSSSTLGSLFIQTRHSISSSDIIRISDSGLESKDDLECCAPVTEWPDVDHGIACKDEFVTDPARAHCKALVLTAPHGNRCDKYCESFGHVCVEAAEEERENCRTKYVASCDQYIADTSDMLCSCMKPNAKAECTAKPTLPPQTPGAIGWRSKPGNQRVGGSHWCSTDVPDIDWSLKFQCPSRGLKVKVLTYNLFWWNLFNQNGGRHRKAGKLIERSGPYDVIGFQECDDVGRILRDARLDHTFTPIDGGNAIAMAYRTDTWEALNSGKGHVAEDSRQQYYGKRAVVWARLRHRSTGKVMFFLNHHGPLPVGTGGKCGGQATAYQILKLLAQKAQKDDLIIVTGDFNAGPGSDTIQALDEKMHRLYTGKTLGDVDHFFSNCAGESFKGGRNLGGGGSDHDALSAEFEF
eukprot:TRINITY_DN5547_c1_g1_i1.p1 TRINITY_DN5547_c1_g1~~TRINITY_DN5547_c1_g1_i1.p1  ORF type:complete len:452 (-),score=74.04 TRINITY_DN5547_c1_g1_i1:77-1432(-)